VELKTVQQLAQYWHTSYDLRKIEARLNISIKSCVEKVWPACPFWNKLIIAAYEPVAVGLQRQMVQLQSVFTSQSV
jgi:hypothetical protein